MRKKIIFIILFIVLLILFKPNKLYYKDGGTVQYEAILWSVIERHTIWEEDGVHGRLEGYEIRILWFEVYDNVKFVPKDYNE